MIRYFCDWCGKDVGENGLRGLLWTLTQQDDLREIAVRSDITNLCATCQDAAGLCTHVGRGIVKDRMTAVLNRLVVRWKAKATGRIKEPSANKTGEKA